METADLTPVVEELIKTHNYHPDQSIGDTASELCDLIKEVKELNTGLVDNGITVIPIYEEDGLEYIEVRYEVAEGFIIVNPEQLDPMDYDAEDFGTSVELFLKDVADRADRIKERFNMEFVRAADYVA